MKRQKGQVYFRTREILSFFPYLALTGISIYLVLTRLNMISPFQYVIVSIASFFWCFYLYSLRNGRILNKNNKKEIYISTIYFLVFTIILFYRLITPLPIVYASSCPASPYCQAQTGCTGGTCPSTYTSGSTCYSNLDTLCCYVSYTSPDTCGSTIQASPSTVATSADSEVTHNPTMSNHIIYYLGRHWAFYTNLTTSSYISWKSSTDGATWSVAQTVDGISTVHDGYAYDVVLDPTNNCIHMASIRESSGGDLYYKRGILNSDGTITWNTSYVVDTAVNFPGTRPSIALDSNGYPWISGHYGSSASAGNRRVWKSSTKDGAWTTDSAVTADMFSASQSATCHGTLVALTGGKMASIYTAGAAPIYSKIWSGSSWGSQETASGTLNISGGITFSSVAIGDTIYLYFLNSSCYENIRTTSWGTPSSAAPVSCAVAKDVATDDLYLWYIGNPTANHVYYKKKPYGGSWGSAVDKWTESDTRDTEKLTTSRFSYGNVVGFYWSTGTASPYNVRYGYISTVGGYCGYASKCTLACSGAGTTCCPISAQKKRGINITNSGSSVLTDYQVAINLTYDSDMQADFSDIRFMNGSENQELSYWLESKSNSQWAYFWVKVPNIPTGTNQNLIYVYYKNYTVVSSASNGVATFDLFDEFTGTSLSSVWSVDSTVTYSVTNSKLNITNCADSTWGVHKGINATLNTVRQNGFLLTTDLQWYEAGNSNMPQVGFVFSNNSYSKPISEYFDDSWSASTAEKVAIVGDSSYASGSGTLALTGTISLRIESYPNNTAMVYWNGTKILTAQNTYAINHFYIMVNKYSTNAFGWFAIDNITIRAYTSPEPTYSVGASTTYYQGMYRDSVACSASSPYCTYADHDRDDAQSYCTASSGGCTAYTWFSSVTAGQNYPCCGNDGTSDIFEQAGSGNSACVNGQSVAHNNADSSYRYAVYNGEEYYCKATGGSGSGYSFVQNVNPRSAVGSCKCDFNGNWACGAPISIRGGRIRVV